MNKTSDKDERYPFVHVRTQLMEAVRGDIKLSDAFTTLPPERDKTIALQPMKDLMMEKAALYDGKDESIHKPVKHNTATKTSRAISALAHQIGIDDDVLTMLVNKRQMDPSTRIHSDIFNTWSRES